VPTVLKSGSLNILEPSEPVQVCVQGLLDLFTLHFNFSLSTVAVAGALSHTKPASAGNLCGPLLPSNSINYFVQETRSEYF